MNRFTCRFLHAGVFVCLAPGALAIGDLEGTWKMIKQECSSGAPYNGFGDNIEGKIDEDMVFGPDQVVGIIALELRYRKPYADDLYRGIQSAIDRAQQQQDGPDKKEFLSQLESSRQYVDRIVSGVRCLYKETMSYSLTGSTLHTDPVSGSTNCPFGDPLILEKKAQTPG